jgi:hypothetical protein
MGPYQLRNIADWQQPFNTDRNGQTYQTGKAVEITQFTWWDGTVHALDFVNVIVASDSGYNWYLDQSQWKVWITTDQAVVWLRNRARHYSTDLPDYYASSDERVYLTDGLTFVSPVDASQTYQHTWGTFCYVDHHDSVSVHGFSAFSGLHDQSVEMLLDKFCRIAGTQAKFLGDIQIPTISLGDGEEFSV